jgi:group I intron endonuclease
MIHLVGTVRYYIGSSANIKKRFGVHRCELNGGYHHSLALQRAWDKYGSGSFEFAPVQAVKPQRDLVAFAKSLTDAEQFWFALYARGPGKMPYFNSLPTAGSHLGYKHTAEAIEKMEQIARSRPPMSDITRGRIGAAHRGRPQDPKHIAKRVSKIIGRKASPDELARIQVMNLGRKRTAQALENMRAGQLGRKIPPEVIAKRLATRAGFTHTIESRQKMSASCMGRKRSPASRAKQSATMTGVPKSPESIAKRTATRKLNAELKKQDQATSAAEASTEEEA